MDSVSGVDVAWLHHQQPRKDKDQRPPALKGPSSLPSPSPPSISRPDDVHSSNGGASNGSHHHHHHHRPPLYSSPSADKHGQDAPPKQPSASLLPALPSPGRRSSWISGITAKFSGTASPHQGSSPSQAKAKPPPTERQPPAPTPVSPGRRASLTEATPAPKDDATPYTPAQPKVSQPSFLQNALRRLSSSGGQLPVVAKVAGRGGLCERRILNVDRNRERCRVRELQTDQAKLRRVAFRVDVEIAGGPRQAVKDRDDEEPAAAQEQARKLKEMGEAEALRHPEKAQNEKDGDGVITVDGRPVDRELAPREGAPPATETKADSTKKKEKKKRSEEERKERKERKRKLAVANGMVPLEVTRDEDNTSPSATPPDAQTPVSQEHPTTDPLRIYRRCCQLRETPVLRKITEQLAAPKCSAVTTPGVVTCLDLSGYALHLADIVTLSDWLAVVPVQKLIMENCGLGDEAVRLILAGLLACRPLSGGRSRRASHEPGRDPGTTPHEHHGVIEKLSLKHNPKVAREGWKCLSLFIHMSRSLKAIDLSGIPFPKPVHGSNGQAQPSPTRDKASLDMSTVLCHAVVERLGGSVLEELVMSECELDAPQIKNIVEGASKCGLRRLGFANNNLTEESVRRIATYLQEGKCEGLDLGGNDLQDLLHILAGALSDTNPLFALSLSGCNLTPSSLARLFPALVSLPNLRFIDLSHNRALFTAQPNAQCLLRKYLPKLRTLKRIHLADVSMSPEHAIALAEILPEMPSLAHLNLLDNPALSALASATNEAEQEEACAFYASMMVAVRVSDTIICIDIDVPGHDSSEIVRALAKQVVAYSLWNMERGPIADYDEGAAAAAADLPAGKKVPMPDALLHLVGHADGDAAEDESDEPATNDAYYIGGTGVAKALGICLGSTAIDARRVSRDQSNVGSGVGSGAATPKAVLEDGELGKGKAKNMSKNLLGSARQIRARLRAAIVREKKAGHEESYSRLVGLDQTLETMILRFEAEYPECRIPRATEVPQAEISPSSSLESSSVLSASPPVPSTDASALDDSDDEPGQPRLKRRDSDVSLASRAQLNEEGRMHRFGQQVRRDLLRPQSLDHAHGTTGMETEPEHLQALRERLEHLESDKIREMVVSRGAEAVLEYLGTSSEELQRLAQQDPERFEKCRQAHLWTERNGGAEEEGEAAATVDAATDEAVVGGT
ncbi:MAG: hypothetical protein M1832_005625 [Thelocarpon impressellum]|nr:MAG: hypothetical protein M1832_005625 [Thelocarpon impressellum]